MDVSLFFSPIAVDTSSYYKEQIGGQMEVYTSSSGFPNWMDAQIVVFGVMEERGALNNSGCGEGPDKIREKLYNLFFDKLPKVVDLGNVLPGDTIQDTYHAVEIIVESAIKEGKTVVLIGGSQDITYPLYKGYEKTEQLVNLTTIDHMFDIGASTDSPVNSETYLSQILLHQPNFLFNYSNIAYQTYFSSPDILGLMDNLFFDKMRLGEVRQNIRNTEPILRNTDIFSFDVSAIQSADMQGSGRSTPNGLLPDEACQITRYAGISEKVSSFGVFEYNPKLDAGGKSATLVAQMIWYFFEGYQFRRKEVPQSSNHQFLKYLVPISGSDEDLVFYKSLHTDRWWMLVPYPENLSNRYRRLNLVPCSYTDYLVAGQDELPELWMKTYRKFL
jgi:arginase family enzyme